MPPSPTLRSDGLRIRYDRPKKLVTLSTTTTTLELTALGAAQLALQLAEIGVLNEIIEAGGGEAGGSEPAG